jgi:hypothetical protein
VLGCGQAPPAHLTSCIRPRVASYLHPRCACFPPQAHTLLPSPRNSCWSPLFPAHCTQLTMHAPSCRLWSPHPHPPKTQISNPQARNQGTALGLTMPLLNPPHPLHPPQPFTPLNPFTPLTPQPP